MHLIFQLCDRLTVARGLRQADKICYPVFQRITGSALIAPLLAIEPYARIVVLTGYADIPTAVEAIKLGAVHYLAKPVETEELIAAFDKTEGDPTVPIAVETSSLSNLEWEHIQKVRECNHVNISATARELACIAARYSAKWKRSTTNTMSLAQLLAQPLSHRYVLTLSMYCLLGNPARNLKAAGSNPAPAISQIFPEIPSCQTRGNWLSEPFSETFVCQS